MARIRNIKPEFFRHEDLTELSALHRLLFIGLWCLADRAGRLEDRPKRIKVEILPWDDCNVDSMLSDLEAGGFIIRYQVEGMRLVQVVSFEKHQRISGKEKQGSSVLPAPPGFQPEEAPEDDRGSDGEAPEKHPGSDEVFSDAPEYGVRSTDSGVQGGTLDSGERSTEGVGASAPPTLDEPSPRTYPEHVHQLASLLADLIESNGCKRPTVTQRWLQDMDLLVRKDGRTTEQVERAIRWCQADGFWRSNILSPGKLREKYETMRLQAERARASPPERPQSNDRIARLAQKLGVTTGDPA